jgi:hypothetical protein
MDEEFNSPAATSENLWNGCHDFSERIRNLVETKQSFLRLKTANSTGGHHFLTVEEQPNIIIDFTIAQFIKGYNKAFIGNRDELKKLIVANRDRLIHMGSIESIDLKRNPEEAYQKMWTKEYSYPKEYFKKMHYVSTNIRYPDFRESFRAGAQDKEFTPEILFRDSKGYSQEADFQQISGSIVEAPQDAAPIKVKIDCGVSAEFDREMATDKLWGCSCAFITDGKKKIMIHLTPGSNFPYLDGRRNINSYAESSARKIAEAITNLQMSKEDTQVVLLGNLGELSEHAKHYYKRQQDSWEKMRAVLQTSGVQSVAIIEMPLDQTIVYHDPKKPDHLTIMGYHTQYNEGGQIQVEKNTAQSYWVPIDGSRQFSIDRPLTREQKIEEFSKTLDENSTLTETEKHKRVLDFISKL